jgi:hypothetical protein
VAGGRGVADVGGQRRTVEFPEVGLRAAHHLADPDVARTSPQPQPAASAAGRFQQTLACQVVDDLHHLALRHAVAHRQLAHRDQTVRAGGALHQRTQCVAGVVGEPHGGP